MIICFCPMLAYTWLNSLKINLYAPFLQKLNKVQTTSSWRYTSSSSSRGTFSEEAKKRYYQRMQQEYEEEQERVVSLHIFIIFFFLYSTINTSMVHLSSMHRWKFEITCIATTYIFIVLALRYHF